VQAVAVVMGGLQLDLTTYDEASDGVGVRSV
jgi:hypothetical protein